MYSTEQLHETHILKVILQDLSEGVVVANPKGEFVLFNPSAEQMLGLGAQDIGPGEWPSVYGCYLSDKVTPFPTERLPLVRALHGEEVAEEIIYIKNPRKPEGLWISVGGRPIFDENGVVACGLAIFRDISLRKNAEERLQSTSLRFSAIVDNEQTGILVENEKREVQLVNSAFCRLFRIPAPPSDLIGRDCTQFVSLARDFLFDADGFSNRINELLHHKTLVTNEKVCLNDGTVLERDYIPVTDGREYLGHVWQYRDVTEREAAVEKAKLIERLSRALAQTGDTVVITDKSGCIEYANQAFEDTTGYSVAEAVGRTPGFLKSGKHDEAFYRDLWRTILDGRTFRGTIVNKKKTGEIYWAQQSITPIKGEDGNITHYVSVLKDITDLLARKEHEVEMRLAREVQQSYYRAAVSQPGFDIAGVACPAVETGGDYYDFVAMPNGRLCVVIGDVSGHGMSAALVMAETRAYIRSFASTGMDPGEVLCRVNQALKTDLVNGRYVTLLLICLDPDRKTMKYAGAGHELGYLLDEWGVVNHLLVSAGPPLGLFSEAEYSSSEAIMLREGQILLLITDGITEFFDLCRQSLTADRAIEYVVAHNQEPAQQIAEGLCDVCISGSANNVLTDDVTAVVLKVL